MQLSFPDGWALTTEIISRNKRFLIDPSDCELILLDQPFFLGSAFVDQVKDAHGKSSCLNIELFNANDKTVSRPLKPRCYSSENEYLVGIDLNCGLVGMEKINFLISFILGYQ